MKFSKVLLIVVGTVVVGGGAFLAVGEVWRLRMELTEKQQAIARLTEQTEEFQRQVAAGQADRKQVEMRLADVREELDSTTQELTRLRNASTEARLHAEELGHEREQLEGQVRRLTRERDEAVEQITQFQSEKAELERSVAKFRERWRFLDRDYQRLAERLKELEQRAADAKQPVLAKPGEFGLVASTGVVPPSMSVAPADPAVPASEPPLSAPPVTLPEAPSESVIPTPEPMSGAAQTGGAIELPPIVVQKGQVWSGLGVRARVIEVNEPHHFVVLDKGAEDGIALGTTLTILRGGVPVGAIVAVRVRPRLAACDVILSRSPEPLQVGDLAVPQSS